MKASKKPRIVSKGRNEPNTPHLQPPATKIATQDPITIDDKSDEESIYVSKQKTTPSMESQVSRKIDVSETSSSTDNGCEASVSCDSTDFAYWNLLSALRIPSCRPRVNCGGLCPILVWPNSASIHNLGCPCFSTRTSSFNPQMRPSNLTLTSPQYQQLGCPLRVHPLDCLLQHRPFKCLGCQCHPQPSTPWQIQDQASSSLRVQFVRKGCVALLLHLSFLLMMTRHFPQMNPLYEYWFFSDLNSFLLTFP